MAAEYVLKEGNPNVLLCERGIRTFETAYRFTLDLTAVPVLKELSHLPVIVDPSHAAGRRSLVEPLSLAAAAAGADGIIVEVHPRARRGDLRRPAAAARRRLRRVRREGRARRGDRRQGALEHARVRIAVLGVGLIGGSVGLAARERLGAEVAGWDPGAGVLDAALERGAVDRAAPDAGGRAGRRRGRVRRRARRRAARRRRAPRSPPPATTASSPTSARPSARSSRPRDDERFIGGHPLAGAETAGVAPRPRRAVRRRDLVPDADRRAPAARSTSACTGCSPASARARRRSTPRRTTACSRPSPTCRTCSPTCSSPRPRGRCRRRASGCPPRGRASATSRAWRAPTRRSGATSTSPTPTR